MKLFWIFSFYVRNVHNNKKQKRPNCQPQKQTLFKPSEQAKNILKSTNIMNCNISLVKQMATSGFMAKKYLHETVLPVGT